MHKVLIIGLGNIGDEYENTRHNIGFSVLDALAEKENVSFKVDRLASVAEYKFKGRTLVLVKPSTFMNLSGKAVNYWMQAEKISIHSILVITDDLALPFGTLRLRSKGSDGGHNGLKDITATLNSTEFSRLRFGIGNLFSKGKQVDFVLNKFNEEEQKLLPEKINTAIEIIKSYATIGVDRTMSLYNKK